MTSEEIRQMALECGLTINGYVMLGVERFANLIAAAVADEPCVCLERGDVAMERYLKRIERMKAEGWRQCAVGQRTTQFCGQLEAAVAAEREECARVCEEHAAEIHGYDKHGYADAIRARGEK